MGRGGRHLPGYLRGVQSPVQRGCQAFSAPPGEIGKPVGPIVERQRLACHGSAPASGSASTRWVSPVRTRRRIPAGGELPRHCRNLYNLSHPESMILPARWSRQPPVVGRDGRPSSPTRKTPLPGDPPSRQDAQARQARLAATTCQAAERAYVRWMKRFGILPGFDPANPINPFETDAACRRSLWRNRSWMESHRADRD